MMRFLSRIDAALIAVPHQWLIDWSQRDRAWWARYTAEVYMVTMAARQVLYLPWDWLAVLALASTAVWVAAFHLGSGTWLDLVAGWRWMRLIGLAFLAFDALVLVLAVAVDYSRPGELVLRTIVTLLFTATMYFAGCRPPAPPRRRHSFNPGFNP